MVDLITFWVNFREQNHEEGGIQKEKSITDNQGKIEGTILWRFVIRGNNIHNIRKTFKSYALR